MYGSIVMLMLAQDVPVKATLQTGRVENGIIVLRPDPKFRGTMRVVPVDPKYCSKMPGAGFD